MEADPAGFCGAPGRGAALGSGILHSDPKMRRVHLGLTFLLCYMRKPFIVPTSQGCWKNQWDGRKNLLVLILGKKSRDV